MSNQPKLSPQDVAYFNSIFPYQQGLWQTGQDLYNQQPGMPQESLNWLNQLKDIYGSNLNNVLSDPNSPVNTANNLFHNIQNGQFDSQINPMYNGFNGQAGTSTYGANTQDMNQYDINAAQANPYGNINASQAGGNFNASQASPTFANTAQNQGYTPTGQVASFMSGGAYQNPFLDKMADSALRKYDQNYNQTTMPSLRAAASAQGGASGYGSNRRYIAEGMAAQEHDQGARDMLSNLYGGAYNLGFGAMSDLTGQQLGGEINRYAQNADLSQNANNLNANLGTNTSMFNAGQQNALTSQGNDISLANAQLRQSADTGNRDAYNMMSLNNANLRQGANLANQGTQYGAQTNNQNAINTANINNTQQQNTNNRFNTQLGFDQATQNAQIGNTAQLNNATLQQQNLGNRVNSLNMPYNAMTDMYGAVNPMIQMPMMPNQMNWQQLQQYAGLLQPYQRLPGGGAAPPQKGGEFSVGDAFALASSGLRFSDIRLKDNIRRLGKENGYTVYTWDWKPNHLGLHGSGVGHVAQEVEITRPDCIVEVNGYKAIRYGDL